MKNLSAYIIATASFISIASGVVGIIWLSATGEWEIILVVLPFVFLGTPLIKVISINSGLTRVCLYFEGKGKVGLAKIFGILHTLFISIIYAFWCFTFILYGIKINHSLLPTLLLFSAVAMIPFCYLALSNYEDPYDHNFVYAFAFFCATLISVLGRLLGDWNVLTIVIIFSVTGFITTGLIYFVFYLIVKEEPFETEWDDRGDK